MQINRQGAKLDRDGRLGVALVQTSYKDDMLGHLDAKIREAARHARLIALSELSTTPYFCQREEVENFGFARGFLAAYDFAKEISHELGIILVISLFRERALGLYDNTAYVFEDGKECGHFTKMHIPDDPSFYEKFYFTQGDSDGFRPIKTSIGKIGLLICWDQWYPEAARIMALNGARLLIYPTAIGCLDDEDEDERMRQKEAWSIMQRSHAIANALPVLSINRCGYEAPSLSHRALSGLDSGLNEKVDSTKLADSGLNEEIHSSKLADEGLGEAAKLGGIDFFGHSMVVGAQGELLCLGSSAPEILYASIDLEASRELRQIWPFLRDRRIDAYEDLLLRSVDKDGLAMARYVLD